MTAPRAPQWPLAPALRLAALALLLGGAALLVEGTLSLVFWIGALVLVILAGVQLAKNWRKRT